MQETSSPTGIRSLDRSARNESLYRQSYPAHTHTHTHTHIYIYIYIELLTLFTSSTLREIFKTYVGLPVNPDIQRVYEHQNDIEIDALCQSHGKTDLILMKVP